MKNEDSVSVSIPRNIFEKICREIRNTNPKAVSKYVTYILKKELSLEQEKVYIEEEKGKIKERLHKLGYF